MLKLRRKPNQLFVGSILSYVQMALGVIIGLLYTPIMIRLLGKSEYGLYNTISSTISMLSVLSLGFNSSYIRYYSKYKKNEDSESIYRLNGLFIIIFSVIGLIALVCGLFFTFNLKLVFDEGLSASEYKTATILMLLLTINLSFSFPMSVFQSIISAHERFIFLKTLGMIKTILSPLVTLPLLLMGYKSIAMVAVTVSIHLITDVIFCFYVIAVLKNRFVFSGFEPGIMRSLFTYTSFIAINMIVDQINWSVDKLLLGRFRGTEVVAIYAVGFSLHSYYNMFSKAVSGVFTPRVHKIINQYSDNLDDRNNELTRLFTKVGRVQYLILALIGSGLIFFGKPFIGFWAGKGYGESYYVALLLTLPSTIALIQNLGIEIQRAENKHQFRSIAYLIMAFINLGMSIVLCQLYGAVGAAFGTAFALIVANGFIMNIYYHKKCGLDVVLFWKNIIMMSRGLIIPAAIGVGMMYFVDYHSVLVLLVCIAIYSLSYGFSMWKLGMNEYEKDLILKPFKMLKTRSRARRLK